MIQTKQILLPVALGAALLGGTVGAFIHSNRSGETAAANNATTSAAPATTQNTQAAKTADADKQQTAENTTDDQEAYRNGFADGFRAKNEGDSNGASTSRTVTRTAVQPTRTVYRSGRSRTVASDNARSTYYDYGSQPRGRSFWQKHRDKLTVAMGTGGGAVIGGLIGGKKGAAIGALAGGGGSALYTYKIRKRQRRY